MKEKKELLEIRKKIKSKKPKFIRQESHKKSKLGKKWRRPKGLQSKLRLNKRGNRKNVTKGYRSPKLVRGLNKAGFKIRSISNLKDIKKINPEKEGALISSTVGLRKKIDLVKKADEKGIIIVNIKDAKKWLKDKEEQINKKKESKKAKKSKRHEKKKKLEDKTEEKKKENLAEKLTEEEKKQKEKEEKDKIIKKGLQK